MGSAIHPFINWGQEYKDCRKARPNVFYVSRRLLLQFTTWASHLAWSGWHAKNCKDTCKSSFTLKWNINQAKQQPINTKIQQIHQHSVAFTNAWDSHLLLLAAKQCFPSSCQPELNSGCYWPLVCSWILSALFEIFWFAWRYTKIQHCDQAWISTKLCHFLGFVDLSVTAVTPVTCGLKSFQLAHANRQN